jgi:hypothetical protein
MHDGTQHTLHSDSGPELRASPHCTGMIGMIFDWYEGGHCPSIVGVSPANVETLAAEHT